MTWIFDTTVLIDLLRGYLPAVEFVDRLDSVPGCSEISRLEVIRGLRSGERADAERLFALVIWHEVNADVSRLAGEYARRYRRSHQNISNEDYLIGATATIAGAKVATANVRHFPMFGRLKAPYRSA